MPASRLTDSQKQDLVERYSAGEASSVLAEAFGCSVNTVSRTVRTLLPAEEYNALKAARAKGLRPVAATAVADSSGESRHQLQSLQQCQRLFQSQCRRLQTLKPAKQILVLDHADDCNAAESAGAGDQEAELSDADHDPANQFHEVAILTGITHADSHVPVPTQPLGPGVLPESVYMLVDKVVELDPRPLE